TDTVARLLGYSTAEELAQALPAVQTITPITLPPFPLPSAGSWNILIRCSDRQGLLIDATDAATNSSFVSQGFIIATTVQATSLEDAQRQYAELISGLVSHVCDGAPPLQTGGFAVWWMSFNGQCDWAVTPYNQQANPLAPYGFKLSESYTTSEEA